MGRLCQVMLKMLFLYTFRIFCKRSLGIIIVRSLGSVGGSLGLAATAATAFLLRGRSIALCRNCRFELFVRFSFDKRLSLSRTLGNFGSLRRYRL